MPASRLRAVALAAAVTAAVALVTPGVAASADSRPASSATPTTVGSGSLPTAQLAGGVGYAQVVIGNTVFVGGNFSGARAAGATSGSSARYNLMSYNLTTGALNAFAPNLNGIVKGLAASPDGSRLYVAGNFTSVNGVARNRLVALDPATGALVTAFNPSVSSQINVVRATASTVYFGGAFTTVNGVSRSRAAAVTASTGAVTGWAPAIPDNSVQSMVLNPDGSKVALGGMFTSVNGQRGAAFAILDSTTGSTMTAAPIRDVITDGSPTSSLGGMSTDGTNIYVSGYYSQTDPLKTGNLEGSFAVTWAGRTVWIQDCHGDEYANAPLNGSLYVVGHPHYCYNVDGGFPQTPGVSSFSPLYQRAVAFSTAATGTVKTNTVLQPRYYDFTGNPAPSMLDWFPTLAAGSFTGSYQAAWNVITSGNYVLLTGEFPTVNGGTQYGTARFALPSVAGSSTDGPQLSGSAWPTTVTSVKAGTARIGWLANYDRDNENLTYTVYRGSTAIYTTTAASRIWYQRPTLSYTDTAVTPGSTYSYQVRATDPFGNTKSSSTISYTVPSTSASAYAQQVLADGASAYWRLGESSGSSVLDTTGAYRATTYGGVTFGATGAIAGDANTAATFDGASGTTISSNDYQGGSDTVSVGAWFRSTATTGGEIIGAGDAKTVTTSTFTPPGGGAPITRTADSGNHDREVATTADGHVTFTVFPGAQKTITSAAGGYNDGKWHQVVGTVGAAGQRLYVDGKQVAADAGTTRALGMAQYWRIGGDSGYSVPDPTAPPGPPAPTPNYFKGSIDEPAVYQGTQLTAAQVAAQFSLAGGAGGTTNAVPTASFTQSATGLTVSVDGSASSDSDGTIASYSWTFGDGGTATGRTASHTYSAAGTYSVRLTVTDDDGATASSTQSIAVSSGPASGAPFAQDAFGRSATGGFGTADTGGSWTVSGTRGNYAVSGGAGRLSTAKSSTLTALLGSVSQSDADVQATFTVPDLPAGGSVFASVIGRRVGTDDYRARAIVASSGAVTLEVDHGSTSLRSAKVSGLSVAAGDRIRIEVQVTGSNPTTVRAKAWKDGAAAPTTWLVTATDSTAALQAPGSVGVGSYAGSGVTNGPLVLGIDDFVAQPTGA